MKKKERSQINNLILQLKELEKEEQTMTKVSGRKEIKIRAETNEWETKKKIEKIPETWVFWKDKQNTQTFS